MSALMLLWFASGIVMTFGGYPSFDEQERLNTTPVLPSLAQALTPRELAARGIHLPLGTEIRSIDGRPAYAFTTKGQRHALDARSGSPIPVLNPARAKSIAEARFGHSAHWLSRHVKADQWTLSSSLAPYFPLHRLGLKDGHGSELYISERTAEIVQVSTRKERLLAWTGAIVHWVYPAMLRRHRDAWRWLVIGLSTLGLIACLSGLGMGAVMFSKALRRRRATRRFIGDGVTPYKEPWLRWHHLFGLTFGVLASCWTFSGAMSLTPFGWSPGSSPPSDVNARWHGSRGDSSWAHPELARTACSEALSVKTLTLNQWQGDPFYLCAQSEDETQLHFSGQRPEVRPRFHFAELGEALAGLVSAPMSERVELHEPDDFHYPSHYRPHFRTPFVRATWTDTVGTTAYVDPHSGKLLRWHTNLSRAERWLYNGLHSWDFRFLYRHPVLWQCVIISALLVGLGLSGSGFVLGCRWLRRAAARRWRRLA